MKFCTGCQKTRPLEGGAVRISGRTRVNRWLCAQCVGRQSVSPYARSEFNDTRGQSQTESKETA